jgi:hypothetical protein
MYSRILKSVHIKSMYNYYLKMVYSTQWGKSIFVFFWIFNFLLFAIDGENNSKTKVEKVFFFTLISKQGFLSLYLAPFKS